MKKNKLILFSLFTISFGAINAQSVSPEILSTSGDYFVNGSSQLSWTLGEISVETYQTSGATLTQGFHQTEMSITAVEDFNIENVISLYPNPVFNQLNLDFGTSSPELYKVTIYDINGKAVYMADYSNANFQRIDMTAYSPGNYTLTLDFESSNHKSFKIIKQH